MGHRVRALREERDWTQRELALRAGVERATVASWETGRRTPEPHVLTRLADLFGVTVDYLLGRTGSRSAPPDSVTEASPASVQRDSEVLDRALKIVQQQENLSDEELEAFRGYLENGLRLLQNVRATGARTRLLPPEQ